MSKWGSFKSNGLKITTAIKTSSLMGVHVISIPMGVGGLLGVNVGVLDRNHCISLARLGGRRKRADYGHILNSI